MAHEVVVVPRSFKLLDELEGERVGKENVKKEWIITDEVDFGGVL